MDTSCAEKYKISEIKNGEAVNDAYGAGLGILSQKFAVKKGKGYSPTEKFLIVGPSGSGKTSLACNLIYYFIKNFCEIVFVMPEESHHDQSIETLKKYCSEIDIPIPVTTITIENLIKGKINNKKEEANAISESSVWVIDDYYTSTGRNKDVEKLLKELVNRGRHAGKHVIYCAQLARNLPNEIKVNNTGIFLAGEIVGDEDLYKYFSLKPPENINELLNLPEKSWFQYDKNQTSMIEFKEPTNSTQIRQNFLSKIPLNIRKNKKKNIISSGEIGNKIATISGVKSSQPLTYAQIFSHVYNKEAIA